MAEIKLDALEWEKYSKDHYVSVRVGEAQKLAKLSASRTYKFPSSAVGQRKYGKVEVYKRVGSAVVCIDPEMAAGINEVEVEFSGGKLCFNAEVNGSGGAKPAPKPKAEPSSPTTASQKAAAYLEEHHLELRLTDAMQAVLRERPADPAAFLADVLSKNAPMVAKLPKVQSPKAAEPADPASPAAPTPPDTQYSPVAAPPTFPTTQASTQAAKEQRMKRLPSVGTWLSFPAPLVVPAATAPAAAAPAATAPAVVAPPTVAAGTADFILKPSVGTWLAPLPKAAGKQSSTPPPSPAPVEEKAPMHLKPSVGTWLAPRPKVVVKEDAPPAQKRPMHLKPSVGTWLAPRPTMEPEIVESAPQSHMVSNLSTLGANFWSMGISPSLSFM